MVVPESEGQVCKMTYVPVLCTLLSSTVSGEAIFTSHHAGMTMGGFIQQSVAQALIELQSNVEKGLRMSTLLWLVPKPSIVKFEHLQQVNPYFVTSIGKS